MERRLLYADSPRTVKKETDGAIRVTDPGGNHVNVTLHREIGGSYQIQTGDGRSTGEAARDGNVAWVRWHGRTYRLELDQGAKRGRASHAGDLSSPMPGQVIKFLVDPGTEVTAGTPLMVVEAMKMQLEIKAIHAGKVKGFFHSEGDAIGAGELLVDLEAAE